MSLPVIEVSKHQLMNPMTEEILHWVGIWTLIFKFTFQYLRVFIIVKGNGEVNYHEQRYTVIKEKKWTQFRSFDSPTHTLG